MLSKNQFTIYVYKDKNGDQLVFTETCEEESNAFSIADNLSLKYERVEILNQDDEKIY